MTREEIQEVLTDVRIYGAACRLEGATGSEQAHVAAAKAFERLARRLYEMEATE